MFLCSALDCSVLALVKGYALSNCIDQHKTWPTPLKYFTTVSSCSVFDCIVLCFHVLFRSSFDYSTVVLTPVYFDTLYLVRIQIIELH